MEVKEKLKETGQRFSEAVGGLKEKLIAKLSEENAQTPEQRLKNARAEEAGAKEAERAAKRALLEVQDEADKYKHYAESAEAKGDSAGVRKFENALNDILEKLKPLEENYREAVAKTAALGEICSEFEAALQAGESEEAVTQPVVETVPVAEPCEEIPPAPVMPEEPAPSEPVESQGE